MPMHANTIRYVREQLQLSEKALDAKLELTPGTIAAAEENATRLPEIAVMRLRALIAEAEKSGAIPDRTNIGALIRQARVALGMTQEQAAAKCNMTQPAYGRIEATANPRYLTIQRIARGVGIPIEWILCGKTPLTHD